MCESLARVTQAFGMLKYSQQYIVYGLNEKQLILFDAIRHYSANWLVKEIDTPTVKTVGFPALSL